MDQSGCFLHLNTPPRVVVTERHRLYWRKNMTLTAMLTIIWAVVSFVVPFFAETLNEYTFLAFPLGFFMASIGALLSFVALTGFYAWRMNRLDHQFGLSEDEEDLLP